MADRRMFSNTVVSSDAFLNMSTAARVLYYHLVMNADNRGYINNLRSIVSSFDELTMNDAEELVVNKFVIKREKGLYLIKHWYIHNDIPTCKVEETRYSDDLKQLYFDENFSYTEKVTDKPVLETLKMFVKEKKKPRKRN